ncbi:hypothetical protein PFISCL1PPCAC_3749, partial [Pristionchus fissidentatus]
SYLSQTMIPAPFPNLETSVRRMLNFNFRKEEWLIIFANLLLIVGMVNTLKLVAYALLLMLILPFPAWGIISLLVKLWKYLSQTT